jgi:hypothetical protein
MEKPIGGQVSANDHITRSQKKLLFELAKLPDDNLILGETIRSISNVHEYNLESIRLAVLNFYKRGWLIRLGRGVYKKSSTFNKTNNE